MRARSTLIAAAAVAASASLAACGSNAAPAASVIAHSPAGTPGPSLIGQSAAVTGPRGAALSVTVTDVSPGSPGSMTPYTVTFTVTNTSKTVAYTGPLVSDLELTGSFGASSHQYAAAVGGAPLGQVTLKPGATESGTAQFEVLPAIAVHDVTFTIPHGTTATWTIG